MSRPIFVSAANAARLRPGARPDRLPEGERLLWQGAPSARALMKRAFHLPALCGYFGVLLVMSAISQAQSGASAHLVAQAVLQRAGLALVPVALIALYAWGIERSTLYSITNKRVVISFGLVVPVTFNIPFSRIEGAGLRLYPSGAGDIPLRLLAGETLSYFIMWPHARPWRMAHTEPMLRCVAGAEAGSRILARALAEELVLPHDSAQQQADVPRQVLDLAGQQVAA
jgi:hypothetical protein